MKIQDQVVIPEFDKGLDRRKGIHGDFAGKFRLPLAICHDVKVCPEIRAQCRPKHGKLSDAPAFAKLGDLLAWNSEFLLPFIARHKMPV